MSRVAPDTVDLSDGVPPSPAGMPGSEVALAPHTGAHPGLTLPDADAAIAELAEESDPLGIAIDDVVDVMDALIDVLDAETDLVARGKIQDRAETIERKERLRDMYQRRLGLLNKAVETFGPVGTDDLEILVEAREELVDALATNRRAIEIAHEASKRLFRVITEITDGVACPVDVYDDTGKTRTKTMERGAAALDQTT